MPDEERLYEALRQTRLELARAQDVPAFVVASNRDLAALAQQRPRTESEMLHVKGFGLKRVEAYGEAFLRVIDEHAATNVLQEPSSPEKQRMSTMSEAAGDEAPPEAWQQRFNELADWRKQTADELGLEANDLLTYPAMRQLAQEPPQTQAELAQIEGVGSIAIERYADALIIAKEPQQAILPASTGDYRFRETIKLGSNAGAISPGPYRTRHRRAPDALPADRRFPPRNGDQQERTGRSQQRRTVPNRHCSRARRTRKRTRRQPGTHTRNPQRTSIQSRNSPRASASGTGVVANPLPLS